MSAVEDIRIKLEQRLSELETEIESLRSALSALDDEEAAAQATGAGATPVAPARGPSTGASPGRTPRAQRTGGGRRTRRASSGNGSAATGADGSSSAELEQLLAETGGLTAVELARQTGTDYAAVLARIRQLEEARRLA